MIRSRVPITSIDKIDGQGTTESVIPQLLVAVADGNIWLVTLPDSNHTSSGGGLACQLWLQHASGAAGLPFSAGSTGLSLSSELTPTQRFGLPISQSRNPVKWLFRLSGAVGVEHVSMVDSSNPGSMIVLRSLVAPTTVVQWTPSIERPDDLSLQRVELDDLEGDQSTCTLSVHGSDKHYAPLLANLFPKTTDLRNTTFVFQGDADGTVRYAELRLASPDQSFSPFQLIGSGTIMTLGEPILAVMPFCAGTLATTTANASVFDTLLVVGVRGQVAVFSTQLGAIEPAVQSTTASRFRMLRLTSGCLQSVAFVEGIQALVFCSQGSLFACSGSELLALAARQSSDPACLERITRRIVLPQVTFFVAHS